MKNHIELNKNIRHSITAVMSDFERQYDNDDGSVQRFVLVPVAALQEIFSDRAKVRGRTSETICPEFSCRYPCPAIPKREKITGETIPVDLGERQLMAIMVADVAEYCRLMHTDEANTVTHLNSYKTIMTRKIDSHGGYVSDACGDNLMAAFMSAVNAVDCAVTIQNRIEEENKRLPQTQRIHFRMGIHLGDVISRGPYLYGNTVNIAARLQGISEPGGIRISRAVYEQVEYQLKFEYCNLGERYVKNIPHPINVYRVGTK